MYACTHTCLGSHTHTMHAHLNVCVHMWMYKCEDVCEGVLSVCMYCICMCATLCTCMCVNVLCAKSVYVSICVNVYVFSNAFICVCVCVFKQIHKNNFLIQKFPSLLDPRTVSHFILSLSLSSHTPKVSHSFCQSHNSSASLTSF